MTTQTAAPSSSVWWTVAAVSVPDSASPPPRRRPPRRAAARPTAAPTCARERPAGVALSAAREVGTNSIPSPSPTGISGRMVTTPSSVNPGIPSTARPDRGTRETEQRRQLLAVTIDQPPGERRGGADEQRDQHQRAGGAERRIAGDPLEVLLGDVEGADHDRERQPGDQRRRQHDPVQRRVGAAVVAAIDRGQQPCDAATAATVSGTSAHQSARHPNATVSSPPSSGPSRFDMPALAPQMPSALPRRSGGKPLTAPGERRRADQPGAGTLDHARHEQLVEASRRAPRRRPRPRTAPGPIERQPARAVAVDELAAGDQHQRVGAEVRAEHGRGRARLVTSRSRATEGSATVIRVPSSWSSAAAAVQAASRVHAERGSGGLAGAAPSAGTAIVAVGHAVQYCDSRAPSGAARLCGDGTLNRRLNLQGPRGRSPILSAMSFSRFSQSYAPTTPALTRDQTRGVFGQVMGLVALTVGCTALGAYVGRNMTGGAGHPVPIVDVRAASSASAPRPSVAASSWRSRCCSVSGCSSGIAVGPILAVLRQGRSGRAVSGRRLRPPLFVGGLGAYGYATRRDLSSWVPHAVLGAAGPDRVRAGGASSSRSPAPTSSTRSLGLVIFGGFTIFDFNRLRRANMASSVPIAAGDLPGHLQHLPVLACRLFGGGGRGVAEPRTRASGQASVVVGR